MFKSINRKRWGASAGKSLFLYPASSQYWVFGLGNSLSPNLNPSLSLHSLQFSLRSPSIQKWTAAIIGNAATSDETHGSRRSKSSSSPPKKNSNLNSATISSPKAINASAGSSLSLPYVNYLYTLSFPLILHPFIYFWIILQSSWEDQETRKVYSCVDLYFVCQVL